MISSSRGICKLRPTLSSYESRYTSPGPRHSTLEPTTAMARAYLSSRSQFFGFRIITTYFLVVTYTCQLLTGILVPSNQVSGYLVITMLLLDISESVGLSQHFTETTRIDAHHGTENVLDLMTDFHQQTSFYGIFGRGSWDF